MTDNEIIKALECCSQTHNCRECVLWEMHSAQCVSDLLSNALSLIESQNAEIAEIQKNSETLAIALVKAKAEIERLRNTVKTDFLTAREQFIVKEMTEDAGK